MAFSEGVQGLRRFSLILAFAMCNTVLTCSPRFLWGVVTSKVLAGLWEPHNSDAPHDWRWGASHVPLAGTGLGTGSASGKDSPALLGLHSGDSPPPPRGLRSPPVSLRSFRSV